MQRSSGRRVGGGKPTTPQRKPERDSRRTRRKEREKDGEEKENDIDLACAQVRESKKQGEMGWTSKETHDRAGTKLKKAERETERG